MTEHEYWDELAAGHALHGLAGDEEALFVTHLETCDRCATAISDHEMVAAQLGSIAHYRETEGEAPSWESMRSRVIGDRAAAAPDVTELAERRARYRSSRWILAAAAAVVVLIGGGIAIWHSTSGGSGCSASLSCHTVQLDTAGGQVAASLVVQGDTVTMDTSAMSPAPDGKAYVLWQLPKDSPATPLKEFDVTEGSTVQAQLSSSYADTTGFAVSLENAGALPARPHDELAQGTAT